MLAVTSALCWCFASSDWYHVAMSAFTRLVNEMVRNEAIYTRREQQEADKIFELLIELAEAEAAAERRRQRLKEL